MVFIIKYRDFVGISLDSIIVQLKGIVDENYRVEIYIHLLNQTRNSCEKYNYRSLAGIEPVIPVQRSNTNLWLELDCQLS
jgi:hypothetical protein